MIKKTYLRFFIRQVYVVNLKISGNISSKNIYRNAPVLRIFIS